jgi:hypothetical protein
MKKLVNNMVATTATFLMISANATGAIVQDFGTAAGKDSIVEPTTGSNHTLLDANLIPSPQDGSFETLAKVGSSTGGTGGVVYVENTMTELFGTSNGAYCRGIASKNPTASTKISPIVNYAGSNEFYTSFKVLFGNANGTAGGVDTGRWQFGQGKNLDGSNSQFNKGNPVSTQGFAVVMFALTHDDSVKISYRMGTASNSNATTGLLRRSLKQGVVYNVELIGNNRSGSNITYDYNGTARTLPPQKFDIYIDGEAFGNNLTAARNDTYLSTGAEINSISFDGTNSPQNTANIFLDDIKVWSVVPREIGGSEEPTPKTAAPSITPAGGNVSPATIITLSGEGTKYYSTNGGTLYTQYTQAFPIGTGVRIKAFAVQEGSTASDTTEATYTKNPELTADNTELSFGETTKNIAKSSGVNLSGVNLSGVNLSGELQLSVTGDAFTVDPTISVNANDSLIRTITIQFTPTEARNYNDTLTISGGGLSQPIKIALTGKGTSSGDEDGGDEQPPFSAPSERITELLVYPNPLYNGQLVIDKGQTLQRERLEIYNTSGALVHVGFVNDDGSQTTVSLSSFPNGLYIVRVGNKMARVLKQ